MVSANDRGGRYGLYRCAIFNQYVRDNLNETAPAKASAAGQIFVSTAANAIAARTPTAGFVSAIESTGSATYTALTTPGPAVTVTTGTQAIVHLTGNVTSSATSGIGYMSFAVSGASTVASSDTTAIGGATTQGIGVGITVLQTGLTAGSNTFTCQYRQSGAVTATFAYRRILIIPL